MERRVAGGMEILTDLSQAMGILVTWLIRPVTLSG